MEKEVQKKDGASDEGSRPRKRVRYVDVQVIEREGASALVQFAVKDEPQRVVVPVEAVEKIKRSGRIDQAVLEAGIPYGEDWKEIKGVTPEIEFELKRMGIWTKADLLERSDEARGALIKALVPPVFSELLNFSKED